MSVTFEGGGRKEFYVVVRVERRNLKMLCDTHWAIHRLLISILTSQIDWMSYPNHTQANFIQTKVS